MKIQSLKQLAALLNQSVAADLPIKGFSVDSRTLLSGEVYCALPGKQVDGHQFVEEAFRKGAVAAIVKEGFASSCGPLLHVSDVLSSLQDLAKQWFHKNRPHQVIAVTGSLGKTTAKEFIATLLGKDVFKSPGNSNSQIGLPLAILNHYDGEEIAVLEMGMTHPGQISKLIEIAFPDIAVLTKVALVHAENFTSLAKIAEAKSEIFLHPQTKLGLYPGELDLIYDLSRRGTCEKKRFTTGNLEVDYEPYGGTAILDKIAHLGAHNAHNLLAALAVGTALNIPLKELQERIDALELPEKRFQRVEKEGIIFINDSYNAAMDSVKAALRALPAPKKGGKRIGILGSMMELGAFSEACHREVGEDALNLVDHLICLGAEYRPAVEVWNQHGRPVDHLADHASIVAKLRSIVSQGDVVLLKGSRSKMMWKVLEEFKL